MKRKWHFCYELIYVIYLIIIVYLFFKSLEENVMYSRIISNIYSGQGIYFNGLLTLFHFKISLRPANLAREETILQSVIARFHT